MSHTKEEEGKERYKEMQDQIGELKKLSQKFKDLCNEFDKRLKYIEEEVLK